MDVEEAIATDIGNLPDETALHGDLETSIRGDAQFISAALSWYDGGPASEDVRSAWSRICAALPKC